MQHIEKITLPFTTEQLFDLVVDVEHYSDFLPGWKKVRVKDKGNKFINVEQELGIPLIHIRFKSFAELDRPRHIHITASGGPFRHFDIHWDFFTLTDHETRVILSVDSDIKNELHEFILNQLVKKSTHSLLDHFAERAYHVYGVPKLSATS